MRRARVSLATAGYGPATVLQRLWKRRRKTEDPRGGLQNEEYRHAEPRELVEDEGVTMGGPGGAPQEGESAAERREREREA